MHAPALQRSAMCFNCPRYMSLRRSESQFELRKAINMLLLWSRDISPLPVNPKQCGQLIVSVAVADPEFPA